MQQTTMNSRGEQQGVPNTMDDLFYTVQKSGGFFLTFKRNPLMSTNFE